MILNAGVRRSAVTAMMLATVIACARPGGEPSADTTWVKPATGCSAVIPSVPSLVGDTVRSLPVADSVLALASRKVPGGLGGVVVRNGTPVILLVEPEKAAAAIAALRALNLAGLPSLDSSTTRVERVRWTYGELYDWYRYVVPRSASSKIVFTAIDQSANRVVIGVVSDVDKREITGRLAALSIPCDLVGVVATGSAPRLL